MTLITTIPNTQPTTTPITVEEESWLPVCTSSDGTIVAAVDILVCTSSDGTIVAVVDILVNVDISTVVVVVVAVNTVVTADVADNMAETLSVPIMQNSMTI